MADPGKIYVLTNPFMRGLVKIGCTAGTIEDRIKQLSGATGVPVAFKCHFAAEVEDMTAKERRLFQLFSDRQVNPRREFFEVAPEKVVLAIMMGPFKEVTPGKPDISPDEEEASDKADQAEKAKRSNLKLDEIGIPIGAELTFTRDQNVHATVVEGNKVRYDGHDLSLSAAAKLALQKLGTIWTSVQGSLFWMFNEKTLEEIRKEKEDKSELSGE